MPASIAAVRSVVRESVGATRARGRRLAAVIERVAIALPPPRILELRAGDGANASGLFSEFASVIGMLDEYERRARYAGVTVNFDAGLYFDPAIGPNWWEYYFTPIRIGDLSHRRHIVGQGLHDAFATRAERGLSRERAGDLVHRYVAVQPTVAALVERVIEQHWRPRVIGVHYRGTDKSVDAPRVPYDEVAARVAREAGDRSDWAVFVASDERPFVAYMEARFGARVIVRDIFRSSDGRPIDVWNADGNYQKGLDAVVDCVLLARSHTLIRTASNLGLAATFFNPSIAVDLLNPER